MSDEICQVARDLCPDLKPCSYELHWSSKKKLSKWARAGYAESIGIINGALFTGLLAAATPMPFAIAVAGGLIVAVLFWIPSLTRK